MRAVVALGLVLAMTASATADRGDELIDRYQLQALRGLTGELAALQLTEPLSPEQYARLIELRERHRLGRIGAVDETEQHVIATTLCASTPDASCVAHVTQALRCLADRCEVNLPADVARVDAVELSAACTKYSTHRRSSALGLGIDWGQGWQRSGHPTDGGAWSLGIETRLRLSRRLGAVARVDRVAGRDAAEDMDGNGVDDRYTGSITRILALAGPSIVLDHVRFEETKRFVRLDLLAGYMGTQSQPDESGPAAGIDLGFHLWAMRLGARVVQGFGGAENATVAVAHLGIVAGGAPPDRQGADCEMQERRSSPFALAVDIPLIGYGISSLGTIATGFGVEGLWHLSKSFDALARADLLLFPGDKRDRVIHQAVLAGFRWDHGKYRWGTRFFTTLAAGYSHEAGPSPSDTDSGPIADLSIGWGGMASEGAAYFRLHGRIGLTAENVDYFAIFFSGGLEGRFDPRRWKDRHP
jgi:hypothetical protein